MPNGELVLQLNDRACLHFYEVAKGFKTLELPHLPRFSLHVISPQQTFWGSIDNFTWVEIDRSGKELNRLTFDHWIKASLIAEKLDHGFLLYEEIHDEWLKTIFVDWEGKRRLIAEQKIEVGFSFFAMPTKKYLSKALLPSFDFARDSLLAAQVYQLMGANEEDKVRTFCKTNSTTVWIGDGFGAYMIQLKKNPFRTFLAQKEYDLNRSTHLATRGLYATKDHLVINIDPFETVQIDLSNGDTQILQHRYEDRIIGNRALAKWGNKGLLKGRDSSLLLIDQHANIQEVWNFGQSRNIWAILPVAGEKVWLGFGSRQGIGYLDVAKQQFVESSTYDPFGKLLGTNCMHITVDSLGQYWFCTDHGLFAYKDSTFHYFGKSASSTSYLPTDNFYHLYIENDSIFWLGTRADGLLRWNRQQGIYQQFTRENGLPNNTIYAVYEDEHAHLWMPSDYGIIQFNKNTHASKIYLPEDGTSEIEFNRISHTTDEEGRIYFGSLNGVTSFHPDDVYRQDSNSPLNCKSLPMDDLIQKKIS